MKQRRIALQSTKAVAFVVLACCALPALAQTQAKPRLTLQQKLKLTEDRMAKLAASHDQVMARMKQIEANLDAIEKKLHEFRLKLEAKAGK